MNVAPAARYAAGVSGDPNLAAVTALLRHRYRVLRRLPWGGLALVYLAERRGQGADGTAPGRRVAVALLPLDCEASPNAAARFRAEAGRLQGLDDPHLVPITAHGITEGVPWLELRWEDAPTVADVLARAGADASPFARERALDVTGQVLRGLAALHAAGVPHWDLTPSNVLLALDAHGWEQARLVGAGVGALVRRLEDAVTGGRAREGSGPAAHRYLAPEIHAGAPADDRADVYAAGALLLHLVAGTLPAEGTPPTEALAHDPEIADVVARAMASRPEDRYASARGMLAAVEDPASESPDERSQPTRQVPALTGDVGSLVPVATRARRASARPVSRGSAVRWLGAGATAALLGMAVAAGVVAAGGDDAATATRAPRAARERPAEPAASPAPADTTRRTPTETTGAADAAGSADTGDDPTALAAVVPGQAPAAAPEDGAVEDGPGEGGSDMVFDVAASGGDDAAPPLEGSLPEELGAYHPRVASGEDLTRDEIGDLYGYLARHPKDVRGHLVLGHAFMNLGWRGDALERYQTAGRLDATATGRDPRVLPALMELLRYDDHHAGAASAIRAIHGADALPLVRAAIETEPRWNVRARLQTLERRLARQAEGDDAG